MLSGREKIPSVDAACVPLPGTWRSRKVTYYFLIFLSFFLWLCWVLVAACELLVAACVWDLVPGPGIEPGPPALGAQSLVHWTTTEGPIYFFNVYFLASS